MAKNLRWRLLAIAAVVAIGVWMIYPLDQKVRLGLDLKGGVHLVLRVQTDEALRVESEASMERLRSELAKAGATGVTATLVSSTIFEIRGVPEAQTALVRQLATELEHTFNRESGAGGTYRFVMKPNIAVQMADDTVAQAIRTIENRVNELGVAEPVVARHGDADQILVQLPGVTNVGRAKEIIRSTALLELKLVEQGPAESREALLQASNGAEPPGQEVVSGIFTQEEAGDLSLTLRSGALPASLTYLEERTVGPSLGRDSIRAGVLASVVGLGLVVVFMLVFYKLSGINAIVAMAINLLVLLALMAYFGATMTLPGIAGFILTIGMGVDSNVLIFERIKEELGAQKGVK